MKTAKNRTSKRSAMATYIVLAGFTSPLAGHAAVIEQKPNDVIAKSQNNETSVLGKQNTAQGQSTTSAVPPIPSADPAPSGAILEVTAQRSNAVPAAQNTVNSASTSDIATKTADNMNQNTDSTSVANGNTGNQGQLAVNTPEVKTQQNAKTSEEGKTTSAQSASNSTQQALVPNGAALQSQLFPLGQSEGFPWSGLLAGGFLILGIAAAGVLTVRLKQGRGFAGTKAEKQLQLITTMSLSPKRQILLVRIRDKEVALASTEHGITMLTELSLEQGSSSALLRDSGGEEPRRRKVQQKVIADEPVKLVSSQATYSEDAGQETAIARSEMLMGALKNLREKNLRNKDSSPNQTTASSNGKQAMQESAPAERKATEPSDSQRNKTESTIKQTRAAFPKYLANAFEQESKRALPQNSNQNQAPQDEAGNVTSMIRERLKELRPLS